MKSHNGGEAERLKALHAYDILDTPSKLEFDDLTALAAQICQTPIALISLLDQTRQWFKSKVGLTVSETPKSVAFCLHTIQSDRPLVVEDALLDERFANNPLVTGEPNIRFYAGVPLIVPSGHRIGTLCVIAPVPMQLTEGQIQTLQALGRQVVNLLELRRTNRLLAERESILKQSEQKFRAIFDGTFQFIGLLNPAGILIEANRPALEAIGVTLADVVGQPFWATSWWTHSPALQAQLKQGICRAAQGEFVRFEAEHILADETSIFVDFSIQPIFDDAGNVIMLIPEGRDISDRIRAEAALRQMNAELETRVQARTEELLSAQMVLQASEEKFRQFAENLNQVFWMTEISKQSLLYISPAYEKIWGRSCESLYQDPSAWLTAIHPKDRERVRSLLPMQLQSEYDVEYRIFRPDGKIRWIRDRSFPIRNAEGQVYRIAGIAEDISDRKNAEGNLQFSEERFRAIFEQAAIGMVQCTLDGKFLRVNSIFCDIIGYSEEELLSMNRQFKSEVQHLEVFQ